MNGKGRPGPIVAIPTFAKDAPSALLFPTFGIRRAPYHCWLGGTEMGTAVDEALVDMSQRIPTHCDRYGPQEPAFPLLSAHSQPLCRSC